MEILFGKDWTEVFSEPGLGEEKKPKNQSWCCPATGNKTNAMDDILS